MSKLLGSLAAFLLVLSCSGRCFGVVVYVLTGSGSGAGTYASTDAIDLSTSHSGSVVFVINTGSSGNVGAITVTANNTSGSTTVIIQGDEISGLAGKVTSVTRHASSTAGVFVSIVSDDEVGPLAVTGVLNSLAGEFTSVTTTGDIARLSAGSGGFTGDITSSGGAIDELVSSNGNVGAFGAPINIRAATKIRAIQALAIYANISGATGYEDDVTIGHIASTSGPIVGSITALTFGDRPSGSSLTRAIISKTDLDADVFLYGTVDVTDAPRAQIKVTDNGYSLLPNRSIIIGGSLDGSSGDDSHIALVFPANGLEGQVIINANNSSGVWEAAATIGSIKIDNARSQPEQAPYYRYGTMVGTTLGGGAIGLVPFNVNDVDCEPENASTVCEVGTLEWPDESVRETLVIRHYGPVFEVGGALPVIVESVDLACPIPGNCPTWQDISSSCDVLVAPDAAGREVWVSLTPTGSQATPVPFTQAYSYRVTPRTYNDGVTRTYLRSDNTGTSPAPNVYPYTYGFTVMCSPP